MRNEKVLWLAAMLPLALTAAACGSSGSNGTTDLGSGGDGGSSCALTAQTTATATVTNGCAVLQRDTSACMAARTAQGLSGAWLKFSCRVTLTVMGSASPPTIQASADSQPDYTSNYFATTDPCYVAYTTAFPDPNVNKAQAFTIRAQKTPIVTSTTMGLGPVGVAVNGVEIFDNQAAPGDDIYKEAGSFDRCGGHPAPGGAYHYHGEPFSISSDDGNLIGVLRDGYFVYGRRDMDGTLPTNLDPKGGHTAVTADSATAVYHYHLNQQTSTAATTIGQKQWFLTTGTYAGVPAN